LSAPLIAVSSSHAEGFLNAIGEAMSSAVPCVVTHVGDSAWVAGDTGMAVQARDPLSLASACQKLFDMGKDRLQKMGGRAPKRIVDNFSLDDVVRHYEHLYGQMLNNCAGAM